MAPSFDLSELEAASGLELAIRYALLAGVSVAVAIGCWRVIVLAQLGAGAALSAAKRFVLSTRALQRTYTVIEQKRLAWQYGESLKLFSESNFTNLRTADLTSRQVEANFAEVNQYAAVGLPHLVDKCPALAERGEATPEAWHAWVDSVLSAVLASGSVVRNGQPVKLEDCVVVDCLSAPGAYFPRTHTDVEWTEFPAADGFQCWFLAKRTNNADGIGNMFICPAEGQQSSFTPSECVPRSVDSKGNVYCAIRRCLPSLWGQLFPQQCSDVFVKPGDVKYLDLDLGTCFVFGPHMWHFSDPRLPGTERVAVNFRVVLRNPDGSIPHRGNAAYMRPFQHTLREGRLYDVNRFDLMH